jgi:serine/threonine protein kinase
LAPGPDVCPRKTCSLAQPSVGWPGFFSFGDQVHERYRVEEILGAGGAGVTYRCMDLINGESTALKVLHGDRQRGTLANRLVIEGEVLELLDHPHIVPFRALHVVGEGPYFLATLHMPGGSLDRFIRQHGPLSPVGAVTAARQLAMALDYVHACGIVHRDLKPANILLEGADPDHPVTCLADFGIARMFRDPRPLLGGLTRTGAFIGTPEYAAPEQVRGEKGIGPAADSFAFGALLHFAVSGEALLDREEIVDWKAFKERSWSPAQRPRLTDLVEAKDAEAADALKLLDSAIDALMHETPSQRLDLGTAAMRFGANPAQLAPIDQPIVAPPTLTGSTAEELDEVFASILDPDALIPRSIVEADTVESLVVPPQLGPSPVADLDGEEVVWPTREQRRNRRHFVFALAAALLVGTAFAHPGGPAALLSPDRAATLGAFGQGIVERFTTEPTAYEARDASEAPASEARTESVRRTRAMPSKRSAQRAAALPIPPPRGKRVEAPSTTAPTVETLSEPAAALPETVGTAPAGDKKILTAAPTVVAVEPVRGWKPRARLSEPIRQPAEEPKEEALGAAMDAWSSSRDDHRPLSEVLRAPEQASRTGLGYEAARQALIDDARAARWLQEARAQDLRVDRMRTAWERAQADARQLHDSEALGSADHDDAIDLDVGILDALFPAAPRIDPMAHSEHCD